MSRLAKLPVILPDGVTFAQTEDTVTVKGPKGELSDHIPAGAVTIKEQSEGLKVDARTESAQDRAAAGLVKKLLDNLVQGVTEEFTKELEYAGVGYRVEVQGNKLVLNVGYSHPVELTAPEGVSLAVQKNVIKVTGADLHAVGQFAANVRAVRPPEPYKGKGIHYVGEHIRRKAGKAGKAAA
jgi:large subunit ribosomal protein L6